MKTSAVPKTRTRRTSLAKVGRIAERPVHGPSSPDLVVAAIKKGILMGRFVPGQRLIEADLTRDLKVSRGPVREALKRMAAEGVVALNPHRGAYVRALTRREVTELMQVLEIVIGLAARLAASRIKQEIRHRRDSSRIKLTLAFKRLEALGVASGRIMQSIERTSLYDAIFEIAGNNELVRINPVVPTQILRMQIHAYIPVDQRNQQFADYRLLYEALMEGDSKRANRIVELHVRRSRMQIQHAPDEAFAMDLAAG